MEQLFLVDSYTYLTVEERMREEGVDEILVSRVLPVICRRFVHPS